MQRERQREREREREREAERNIPNLTKTLSPKSVHPYVDPPALLVVALLPPQGKPGRGAVL